MRQEKKTRKVKYEHKKKEEKKTGSKIKQSYHTELTRFKNASAVIGLCLQSSN